MRTIALAIMFLACCTQSSNPSQFAQGFFGYVGVVTFLGFWFCLIGGW